MQRVINIKELRASMPEIIKRVRQGDRYIVLYRSNPAFRIVPVEADEEIAIPLTDDPLYKAPAVGRSKDAFSARDHDVLLYGNKAR